MAEEEKKEVKKERISGKFIVILIVVLIILVGGYKFYNPVSEFLKEKFSGVSGYVKPFSEIISHPEKELGKFGDWKPDTKAVEKEKPKGVEIIKFEVDTTSYKAGEGVDAAAIVRLYGLEDRSTEFIFKCLSEEKEGEVFISGKEGNFISILERGSEYTEVGCKFENLDVGKHDLTLNVKSELVTKGWVRIYVLEKEKLTYFNSEEIDAFDYYDIKERNLNKGTGVVSSEYEYGPLKVTLGLNKEQPIDEEGLYILNIILNEDTSWKGKVSKIRSMELIMPFNLEFDEDCVFGQNLILTEESFEEGEALRSQLKGEGLEFKCKFSVTEASEDLTFTKIELKTVYDYIFEKETSVEIV